MSIQIGNLTAIGVVKEASFGAFGTTAFWLPSKSIAVEKAPNPILPEVMHNTRGAYTSVSEGIQKISGPLNFPLYPDDGMVLLAGAMGKESATTGSSPSAATTLSSSAVAGDTVVHAVATFTMNDIVQIGTTISGIAETRKVSSVSGSGPFDVTLDKALTRGHLSGVAISKVVAPFTHTFDESTDIPSFAVEQNMNGLDIQWGGLVVSQYGVKIPAGGETDVTVTFEGQRSQVLGSPAVPTFSSDAAFMGTGGTLNLGGVDDLTGTNVEININNDAKPYPTLNGQVYPQYVAPGTRKISLKSTVFLQSLSGGAASQGYFADLAGVPLNAGILTLVSGTNQIIFNLPSMTLMKAPIKTPLGVIDMYDLEYTPIDGGTFKQDLRVQVINAIYSSYLP